MMRRLNRINRQFRDCSGSLSRPFGGFTLVEILIVVIILGILAAIVIPQFAGATQEARDNMLKENLRNLRTQVNVYRAQHRDVSPGYPDGDTDAAPTEAAFIEQMTELTDIDGFTVANGANAAEAIYGPYLRQIPENPVNQLATVEILDVGAGALVGDESHGWIFRPNDAVFIADSEDPYDTY